MNDTPERRRDGQKRAYAKPAVRRVALRPEEAVLGNCKTGTSVGPGQGTCQVPSNCSTVGS